MACHSYVHSGDEKSAGSPFPKPVIGAVLATKDGIILGRGRSSHDRDAVQDVLINAGIQVTPLSEWCVSWPHDKAFRGKLAGSTLYITLEPSDERKGYVSCVLLFMNKKSCLYF